MNRAQKIAWCLIVFITLGLIISAAIAIFRPKLGWPWPIAFVCFSFLGIAGTVVLAIVIYKKDKSKIIYDERDLLIGKRAALAGFSSAFSFTCIACMLLWFILGGNDVTVSVNWFPLIFTGAGITHTYFYSLTLLIEYGRGGKENE